MRQVAGQWPAKWLDKYANKVFEVVKHAIFYADLKSNGTAKKALNQPKLSKKPLTATAELESAFTATSIATFTPVIRPSSLSTENATSMNTPKTPTQSKQKCVDLVADPELPLRSRNLSLAQQQKVENEMQKVCSNGRTLRQSVAKSCIARVDAVRERLL